MADAAITVTDEATGLDVLMVSHTHGTLGTVHRQIVVPEPRRIVIGRVAVGAFRVIGSAASPQNLMAIENDSVDGNIMVIRNLTCEADTTAALAAVASIVSTSRVATSGISGGTSLNKVLVDTAGTTDANVRVLGGASADGTNSTITATAGAHLKRAFVPRMHTLAGQNLSPAQPLLPESCLQDGYPLRPGEGLLVQLTNPTGSNNAATYHYVLNVEWDLCSSIP
jgi:hypothetical protein